MPRCIVPSLYTLSIEALVPSINKAASSFDWDNRKIQKALGKLPESLLEDVMRHVYFIRSRRDCYRWKEDWRIFFLSKIKSAILRWDEEHLQALSKRCKNVNCVLVSQWDDFKPNSLKLLPPTVETLDFDGELFFSGHNCAPFTQERPQCWLSEAESLLRNLYIASLEKRKYAHVTPYGTHLLELHMGDVDLSTADLSVILKQNPQLQLLRHYKLVQALYELHGKQWQENSVYLPKYNLRNIDVDFSHVTQQTSAEFVSNLPSNVLQMATILCPMAIEVHARFDCETPNDVLAPLSSLDNLEKFSVVCVSSGTRTLADFRDFVPLLKKYGATIRMLELKVIEYVDVHIIVKYCSNLQHLILSGNEYVMPTCSRYYPCADLGKLTSLQVFFFGGEFSDHFIPECFWKATLSSRDLRGIFLEYPRIKQELLRSIIKANAFRKLQVISFCSYEELTSDDVLGLLRKKCPLSLIRMSNCDNFGDIERQIFREFMREKNLQADIKINK